MPDQVAETSEEQKAPGSLWQNAKFQLAMLVVLYLVLRLPWVFTLPVTEAPDESNHYWVCEFLTTHLRLPSGQEVLSAGGPAEYGSLPQFGYLPNSLLCLFGNADARPLLARLGSVVAGLPTLFAAYFIGKEIFPLSRFKILAMPLLIVLHPQLIFTQSYTNTDATTVSLASVSICIIVRAIKHGLSINASLLLGFLLGWMALSKHTGLSIVPALGIGVLAATLGRGEAVATALKKIAAAGLVFCATCGWWFVRNYYEFNGDILGSRTMYETWSKILPRKNGAIVHPWPEVHQFGWWRFVFFDFFGLFGYMNRYVYRPAYIVYFIYVIAAIAGWARCLFSPKSVGPKADRMIWLIFLLCPLLNLAAMITATMLKVTGPHGRYLFPSIVAIDALIIAGLFRLGDKFGKWATIVLLALHLAVSLGSWAVYYGPLAR
jgi:hypothetical protein